MKGFVSSVFFRYRKHVKRGPTFFCKHCSGTGKLKENTIAAKLSDGKCTECGGTGKRQPRIKSFIPKNICEANPCQFV